MIENLLFSLGMVGLYRIAIYSLGDVYNEYNPKAIFAWVSAKMAEKRLFKLGIFEFPSIVSANNAEMHILNKESINSYLIDRVKPVAGWLNAVSFCPTCTSVYVLALIVWLPTGSISMYGISLLFSRLIFKYL